MQVPRVNEKVFVTPESLQAQSKLIETLGKIKSFLKLNRAEIVKRRNDYGGKLGDFCFFKIGELDSLTKKFDSSSAFMESIVWDIAVIFKMSAHFVPTGLVRVNYLQKTIQNASGSANEKYHIYHVNVSNRRSAIASFQPAEKGDSLTLSDTVPDEEFAHALMYSLVLGQYDHHFLNLIKNFKNELMSFDNTLCLPPSNGFLNLWNQHIVRSIRPSFLALKNGAKPLTFNLKELCLSLLSECKKQLPSLEAYLASYLTKKKIARLKPGWFDARKSVLSLSERIDRIEETLRSPNIKTFRELVLSAFEDYRTTIGIQILRHPECTQDSIFTRDGIELVKGLEELKERKLSFEEFKALIDHFEDYGDWFLKMRDLKGKGFIDPAWDKYRDKILSQSALEVKGDIYSASYLSNELMKTLYRDSDRIFINGFDERVLSLNEEIYPVDITTKIGKFIVKAHRGELPPLTIDQADEGLYVLKFLKEMEERAIPFKLVDSETREKFMFEMDDYSYYVEQVSAADKPSFSIVYKTDKNPRIIPLKVLDFQVLKLLIPPCVKPLRTAVEINGCSYEALVDSQNRLVIKMFEGYLPRMTQEEFAIWTQGPMLEKNILLTISLYNNKCLHDSELNKAINEIEDYLIVQLLDKPGMVLKLFIREEMSIAAYDLKIKKEQDEEEVFLLTDSNGRLTSLSQQEFTNKLHNLD